MSAPLAVVKIGGSLAEDPAGLHAALGRALADPGVVVVPGGGVLAQAVRDCQAALRFGDGLAHRLALDAMGAMAEILASLDRRLCVARDLAGIRRILATGVTPVWDPADLRQGNPTIPESWSVTSDSLALWLARTLPAESCTLYKSVDAPAGADPTALARAGLVDAAFPDFACAYAGTIAIAGPGGTRLVSRPASPVAA